MAENGVTRRLAAILSADVAGYSRLMGADEEGTLKALTACREIMDGLVASHRGRVFGSAGDSVIAEFASPVEAVRCAIAFQRALEERNSDLHEGRRMEFRIGINLGDVMVEGDDIYGDGVNVAARLEKISEPGGLCISATVFEQVRDRVPHDFEDTGEHEVKNIARPVRVWRWRASGAARADPAGPASGSAPGFAGRPAIAVLAFDNLSGDPEQEYFADGIAEDIITGLALWRSFPVIARNSSFTYKGKSVDMKQVAKDLGARYVLEGSVRKAGERVRITSQLIDAETGAHVWAERYDRDLTDIFAIQDEITGQIVAHVAPEISLAEAERASRQQATDLGAWELFQRGMWHQNRLTSEDNAKARAIFAQAAAADPRMALPVAWTAWAHILDLMLDWSEDRAQTVSACMSTAKRAVALDPRESASHAMLAGALVIHRQPQSAVAEGTHAVELNPSLAIAHFFLGYALIYAGRSSEAVGEFETARGLSPRDPFSSYFWAVQSLAHVVLREFDAAIDCAQRALHDSPENVRAHHRLACALGHRGDLEAARAALEESRRFLPDPMPEFFDATYPFTDPKDLAFFLDGLRKAGWHG